MISATLVPVDGVAGTEFIVLFIFGMPLLEASCIDAAWTRVSLYEF